MCVEIDQVIPIFPHKDGGENIPGTYELKREAGERLLGPGKGILAGITLEPPVMKPTIKRFLELGERIGRK